MGQMRKSKNSSRQNAGPQHGLCRGQRGRDTGIPTSLQRVAESDGNKAIGVAEEDGELFLETGDAESGMGRKGRGLCAGSATV